MAIICDLYARVSGDKQVEEGYSLGEQEERLRAYAAAQGWKINAVHIDPAFTGKDMDRPGLQAVIADAKARKIQKVVTYKLDRLSRSQKDTLYLIEDVFLPNGVDYISMTESFDTGTPVGRAVLGLLAVFAQLEREQIKERMMMGRVASAKEGNWRGGSGVPIGYRYLPKTSTEEGRLVVEPYEAQIVRDVFTQFLNGKTFHAIYDYCRQRYTTSYGSFAGGGAALIPAMLLNRAYIGEIKYAGQWYPGKHEPIITPETFQRAQDKMVEYRANLDAHKRAPFQAGHLLTGFLYCGECGARWCYHGCSYKNKAGEKIVYGTYSCYTKNSHKTMRGADRCSIPVWPAAELEEVVWSQLLNLSYEDLKREPDDNEDKLRLLEKEVADLDKSRARLVDLYALGTLPLDVIQEKAQQLQEKREKLLQQCDVLRRGSSRPTEEEIRNALGHVHDVYASGSVEAGRDLLRVLVKKITLEKDRKVSIEWNL